MSLNYSHETAHADVKINSRKKIAEDAAELIRQNDQPIRFHYLGGRSQETPFEDLILELLKERKKDIRFIRYEKLAAETPKSYHKVEIIPWDRVRTKINYLKTEIECLKNSNSYGIFINQDFFTEHGRVNNYIIQDDIIPYYWLDFCCSPHPAIINKMNHSVISCMEQDPNSVCYATFYLNPRGWNDKETLKVFGGKGQGYEREDRAKHLRDYLNKKNQNIHCEIFDLYNNGPSPMGVFKFVHVKTMKTKPRTVEGYVELRNEGYTHKQIAVYWRVKPAQVAAWAAHAKRRRLVS